ncbi:PAS domain-containing sensor histidine kinase [Methanocalculus sp.]|uniref:PAS domain-containing sensor histidine kinase n=1 Tax=Methanocalculus sp. TaxID=2004547 RepID=UPI0027219EC4|nr:PAS domain-containing sensor histidine kinase [Methanocalculus sp.]MDO8841851.1 PAS domain-containing sensor histidine kinase [Methanocalculus sp.]
MISSAIQETIARFSHALPIGICIINSEKQILLWNRTLAEWSGLSQEEVTEKKLDELYPHLHSISYRLRIEQVLEGGPPAIFSSQLHASFIPCQMQDGALRVQHTSVIRYPGGDTNEIQAMIIIEDVTELDHEIRAFRSMRDQALAEVRERAKAEKSLLLTNRKLKLLSSITRHDILNEVTVLLGNANFLEETIPEEGDERRFIDAILHSTEKIQKQITFTGEYDALGVQEPGWYRIEDIAKNASSILYVSTIQLIIQSGSLEVYADPMFEKVFMNIISNAIMHGETVTTITISWKVHAEEAIITIADDGIGIPADQKAKIFNRGYGKNTGLGLFLSREILDITGLSIIEVGREGTAFEIHVPSDRFRMGDTP